MSRAGENNGFVDPATGRFGSTSFSVLTFQRLSAHRSALADVFAFAPFSNVNLQVNGRPEVNASAQYVSGTYYSGLGVTAFLGRTITSDDDRTAAPPVVVISFRYWERRFGGDRAALGQVIEINTVPVVIVGVTPQGFDGALQAGESADVSVPLAHHLRLQPDRAARARPSYWWIRIMGRRAPGVSPAQAAASLEPIFQEAAREGWLNDRAAVTGPDEPMPDLPTLVADPGGQGENDVRRQFARPLRILMGLVALVLLAACANLANLLLARSAARRRDVAVRIALGASRGRIVRQLFTESLLLAVAGAALGTALAWWARGLLLTLRPFGNASAVLDLPIDTRVLAFTTGMTIATTLLFGLAPALRATRVDLIAQFQSARTLGSRGRARLNQALMVVQIALSLLLLVTTGLFVRTLSNLQGVDAGFNRDNLILFRIDATSAGYARDRFLGLQTRVQERVESLPGVRSVTFSSVPLLSGVRQNKRIMVPGHQPPPGTSMIVNTNGLAPNFFTAMQLPMLLGRGFTEADTQTATRVAVVNQTFVRTYFDGENPVGHIITIGSTPDDRVEIVGVARDAKYTELRGPTPATIYLPASQRIDGDATFAVRAGTPGSEQRSGQGLAAVANAILGAVHDIDPKLPVLNLRTQDEQIDRLHAQPLLFARLSGLFSGLAIALTCIGLYGLISYTVVRRTGEIGLRMALGARPGRVLQMILRESMVLACLGIVVGAGCAYGSGRLLAGMLFGLSPGDPVTYLVGAIILIAIAVVSSLLPALRASRIQPMIALKID